MRRTNLLLSVVATAALAACAANPTLFFADNLTIGLQLGANAASSGGGVTLGYKNQSVAVVPVSVLDENGKAHALRSTNGDGDALSVFAVFESAAASAPSSRVHIGQIFSTGMAAQVLTQGYECNLRGKSACAIAPEMPASSAAFAAQAAAAASAAEGSATRAEAAAVAAQAGATGSVAAAAPSASDRPRQTPLIYARTDVLGFDIGGSATEQGAVFTLGFSSRNLALVPVYTSSSGERVSGLYARLGEVPNSRDGFSVLGRFKADTSTTGLCFGIERFFATGMAALNLGQGLGAAVAAASPASAASAACQ